MGNPQPSRHDAAAAPRVAAVLFAALYLLLFGPACATAPAETQPETSAETPRLKPGIYAVETGEPIGEKALYRRLADYTFVVVGESHDNTWDHEIQSRVYGALLKRRDASVALGMEMFQRPFQSALDAYIDGEIDEQTMLDRAEWSTRWGMATESYAALWRRARNTGSPLVALNARRELSKRVADVGLDALDPALRQELPEQMDLTMEGHRDLVRKAFGAHGPPSEEAFERFYQAQVVWDETMAHTAYSFMRSNPDVASMVILCGRFHAYPAFGIPPRIERRAGGDVAATLLPISKDAPEAKYSLGELRERQIADFVWVR
jgi:uncharacterized iron-regulated protein